MLIDLSSSTSRRVELPLLSSWGPAIRIIALAPLVQGAHGGKQKSSRSPASRSLVRENSGSRALGPRDPAAASAAGAWGAEDGEARSALTVWGIRAVANFSHRGSSGAGVPDPQWLRGSVGGSPLASCGGQAHRTPTPSKLGRVGRAEVAASRTRPLSRSEAPPRGLELQSRDPHAEPMRRPGAAGSGQGAHSGPGSPRGTAAG